MLGFNVFVIFLLVLFIFIVIAAVKIIPQGYNYTVEPSAAMHARSVRASPLSSHSSTASGGSST